ncbi:hypothetical protein SEA_ELEPHANTOON_92 [Mycobacterium phage Elephantoon]|nr:hypothetical protein SEA_ELEPHANTOON_92 [Mycobacterium phage Elephantoon]
MSYQCRVCFTLGDERSFPNSDEYCEQHDDREE